MLRRLEKRILVGLPSASARKAMINHWLPPISNTGGVELRTELAYDVLAEVRHIKSCPSTENKLTSFLVRCFSLMLCYISHNVV